MTKILLAAGILAVAFNASAAYSLQHLSDGSSELSVSGYDTPSDIKRLNGHIARFTLALKKAKSASVKTAQTMEARCSGFFTGGCKKAEEAYGRAVKEVEDYENDLRLLNKAVAKVERNILARLEHKKAIAAAEAARIAKYQAEQEANRIAKQKAEAERQRRIRAYNKRKQAQVAIAKAEYDALPPEAKSKACFKQADRIRDKSTDALQFAKRMYDVSYAAWVDSVGARRAKELATQQTDSDFRVARFYSRKHAAKLAECRAIKIRASH